MTGNTPDTRLNRREFTKAVGGAGVLAAATDPTVAASMGAGRPERVADLDPVEEAFTPEEWLAVGPFQSQSREGETGWLFPVAPEDDFGTGAATAAVGQRLQSASAGGATVTWERREASGSSVDLSFAGRVDPTFGDLRPLSDGLFSPAPGLTDDDQDWFGLGGLLTAAYGFTTVEMDGPRRAVLESDATVYLNGRKYDSEKAGVVLQEGTNYLLVKTSAFLAANSVSLRFRPPRAAVEVDSLAAFRGTPQNAVLPDLIEGQETDRPASVRVTNTTGERLETVTLEFAPDSDAIEAHTETVDPPLAPFETRRINTRVQTTGPLQPSASSADAAETVTESVPGLGQTSTVTAEAMTEEAREQMAGGDAATFEVGAESNGPVEVVARVTANGESDSRDIPLRVRSADTASFQDTFLSAVDESVQEYSVRRPSNPDDPPADGWELIVTLHGAGVPSINQAGGQYTRKEDTYILAPAARGPINYDHEDLGRIDDLEAIETFKQRYDVDDSAVYLTGHSMGGHGTWHVGLTNPDRFAGLAPSAGWTDFDSYISTVLGRDKMHTHPRLHAVPTTAQYNNLALPKTENAADGTLPVFVLQGGQDSSVPSVHPRTYVRALANRGLDAEGQVGRRFRVSPDERDVAYLEVPGQSHYWDDGIGPGTDTVNHPDLIDFLTSTSRDPYPEQVQFFTTNLAVEDSKYWVGVRLQRTAQATTRVSADASGDSVAVETENVAVLTIDPAILEEASGGRGGGRGRPTVTVNGTEVTVPANVGDTVYVDLRGGRPVVRPRDPVSGAVKDADGYGPVQQVHYSPYRLVYGTQGSEADTATARNLANLRSARLVDRARAPAPVVPDTAVDAETVANYNLVLFGRPGTNAVYDRVADDLPIDVGDGTASVGGQEYTGDLAVEFIYPNPEDEQRFVQVETGTSLRGLRLTAARNWIPTGVGVGDYQIYDESIRYRRYNAALAAGFFDIEWDLDPQLGYLRTE